MRTDDGPPDYDMATDYDSGVGPTRHRTTKEKILGVLRKNLIIILLLIGMAIGIGIGMGIRSSDPDFGKDPRKVMYLNYPGELFLRMLKVLIIPLVVTSMIVGMANLPNQARGKIGAYAVAYYILTTFLSVLLGILLVLTIRPGDRGRPNTNSKQRNDNPIDALLDLIRNLFPPNIFEATMDQSRTKITWKESIYSNTSGNYTYLVEDKISAAMGGGTNVLGIICFSLIFGSFVGKMGERGKPLLHFFEAALEVIMKMVFLVIWLSPVGVCFLLAARIVKMTDPAVEFASLGWYMMTVLLGIAIHYFILLPIIYVVVTRKNPYRHMWNMLDALLMALGTASSSATMPVTVRCAVTKAGIDPRIAEFVIPVGATINMDGTALYEAVASIYIAQSLGIYLGADKVVIVSLTATAAAIGAAGIPEAGLVTMAIVLEAVGLPVDAIAMILAVDWFLDRCRTSLNVWGDSVGAGVMDSLAKKMLKNLDEETQAKDEGPYEYPNGLVIANQSYGEFTQL